MKASTKTYVVDANVILRFLTRDDEALWSKSVAIVAAMDAGQIELLCDPVTLAEIVFVLQSFYKLTREHIYQLLSPLVNATGFNIPNKDLYTQALKLYGSSIPHFGDACACAAALKDCEGRLMSFDKKLSAVEGVQRAEKPQ